MSDEKTLMTEVLPTPRPVIPSSGPRERVAKHWHTLVTAGAATAALAGCGCLVMDPMPPPALCRTTNSVLASLEVTARGVGNSVAVQVRYSGATYADYAQIELQVLSVEGARELATDGGAFAVPGELGLAPTSDGATITLVLGTRCNGATTPAVKAVLVPVGGAGDAGADAGSASSYTVTLSELVDGGR